MQERAKQLFTDLLSKWNELEKRQKIRIVAVIFVIFLSLGVTIFILAKPNWVTLVESRPENEIKQIQTALDDMSIKNKLSNNGTAIEVESKNFVQAKVNLSTTDIAKTGAFTFQDAINFSGMGATEMVKKASFKYLAETELANQILLFDGIKSARVNLAIPENNSYFIENSQKPSASVLIESDNKTLSKGEAEAIASLVAAGVVDLSVSNVEVIANDFTLYSQKKDNGSLTQEEELINLRKREMDSNVRENIRPLFDSVQITSNLVFDFDKSKTIDKVVTPPIQDSEIGVPKNKKTEEQEVTNSDMGNPVGLNANDQTTPEYMLQNSSNVSEATVKNTDTEYIYNEKESVTEKGLGKLIPNESSMLITAYKFKNYDQDYMEKNNLLTGSWADFKESTIEKKLQIDDDLLKAIVIGTGINNVSIIGYEIPIFNDRLTKPLNVSLGIVYASLATLILLLAYGIVKSTKPDEIIEIEPELSVEDLLVSTKIDQEKEKELTRLEEIDYGKESETKRKIEKFVVEKPEAVAQLLRNWLNEDWE